MGVLLLSTESYELYKRLDNTMKSYLDRKESTSTLSKDRQIEINRLVTKLIESMRNEMIK